MKLHHFVGGRCEWCNAESPEARECVEREEKQIGEAASSHQFSQPPQFSSSVGRVFRLYSSGLYGCCGAAVAISKSKFLSSRHLFEKGSQIYQGPVVVFIASQFLNATIDGRSRGLDVVSMTLSKTCDAIQPLPKAESRFFRMLQPVVLVHFPLFHDNSVFNTHYTIMKEKLGEEKFKETNSVKVHEFRIDPKKPKKGKGITFYPGANVLLEPLLSSGTLGARYPERGRGYASYHCFQNSSGGAVVIDTPRGWQLLGIHLGATTDDNSALTHVLLATEQLEEAGIELPSSAEKRNIQKVEESEEESAGVKIPSSAQKRKIEIAEESEIESDDARSLSSEEDVRHGIFVENLGYFSFVEDIEIRLGTYVEKPQSIARAFWLEDDDLYDDDDTDICEFLPR